MNSILTHSHAHACTQATVIEAYDVSYYSSILRQQQYTLNASEVAICTHAYLHVHTLNASEVAICTHAYLHVHTLNASEVAICAHAYLHVHTLNDSEVANSLRYDHAHTCIHPHAQTCTHAHAPMHTFTTSTGGKVLSL